MEQKPKADFLSLEMKWRDPATGEMQCRAIDAMHFDDALPSFVEFVKRSRGELPAHLRSRDGS
jgi:hypothetical protein